MKLLRNFLGLAVLTLAGSSFAGGGPTLKIGNPAPAMKVYKWAKGTPVPKFEKGKVYVVEFWATWCGPCRESIPHLTQLAKKYAGKVTFTGVDAFEHEPNPSTCVSKVQKFVDDFGPKMDYHVAIDGVEGTMAKTWMDAAQEPGIPTAFVVDQTGTIAWIGHPMFGLDEVLGRIENGTYNRQAEIKLKDKEIAAQAEQQSQQAAAMEKTKAFMTPFAAKKYPETVAAADKAFAADPQLETSYAGLKFVALAQYDMPGAAKYARKLASGIYQGNAEAMNQMAWFIVGQPVMIKNGDYALAVELAQKGVDWSKGMPAEHLAILDTLATAYAKLGKFDKAVEIEQEVVTKCATVTGVPAEEVAQFKTTLDRFKKKQS